MLARDLLGTRSLPLADGVDEAPVVVLGDEQDLARTRQHRVRGEDRARRRERQREDVGDRAFEVRAAGERGEAAVIRLVELDVALDLALVAADRVDDLVELGRRRLERHELVRRLEPLRRETRRGALEDAAELDRVGDVAAGERPDDETAAAQRLEDASCASVASAIRSGVRETPRRS